MSTWTRHRSAGCNAPHTVRAVPPASEAPPPRPSADTRLGRRRSSHLPCGFALAGFANRGRFYPRGCGLCRTVWATYNDGITRQFPSPTITLGRAGGGRSRTPPLTRFDRGLGARILQPPPRRVLNRPTRPSRQGIRTGDLVKREHFLYGEALFLPATPKSNTHTGSIGSVLRSSASNAVDANNDRRCLSWAWYPRPLGSTWGITDSGASRPPHPSSLRSAQSYETYAQDTTVGAPPTVTGKAPPRQQVLYKE